MFKESGAKRPDMQEREATEREQQEGRCKNSIAEIMLAGLLPA